MIRIGDTVWWFTPNTNTRNLGVVLGKSKRPGFVVVQLEDGSRRGVHGAVLRTLT